MSLNKFISPRRQILHITLPLHFWSYKSTYLFSYKRKIRLLEFVVPWLEVKGYENSYSSSSFLLHPYLIIIGDLSPVANSFGISTDAHAIRYEFHSTPTFPSGEMDIAPPEKGALLVTTDNYWNSVSAWY